MRRFLFTLSLLAATTGFAQNPSSVSSATDVQFPRLVPRGDCPVDMRVQQQPWGGRTEWVVSLEDAREPQRGVVAATAQIGVHVALETPKDKSLSSVELVVHYLGPHSRILPITGSGVATRGAAELKKTFELSSEDGPGRRLAGSLLIGAPATVTRVDLMRITYADDSTWRARASGCSVSPSLFVLVQARPPG